MKPRNIFLSVALSLSVVSTGAVFILTRGNPSTKVVSETTTYALSIDSYSGLTNAQTKSGYPIHFATNGFSESTGVGSLSNGGTIYNTTKINGISEISVTLASGDIRIWYGRDGTNWLDYVHATEYDLSAIGPGYFKIEALADTTISSINVNYDCVDYDESTIPYSVYINGEKADVIWSDAGENAGIKQFLVTLDVYRGDVLTFKKNDTAIYPIAQYDGNNAEHLNNPNTLVVRQSAKSAHMYLKLLTENSYDVWLEGYTGTHHDTTIIGKTLLQAWNWSIANIKNNIDAIAGAGFTAVQVSPLQVHKGISTTKLWYQDNEWSSFYRPESFSIATSTNENILGTKSELKELCALAATKGVDIIVDTVVNHLDGTKTSFSSNTWGYESAIASAGLYHTYGNMSDDKPTTDDSQEGTIRGCLGNYPDIKTESPIVQNRVLSLLKEYVDCGVKGFRFDAAKHIETPFDGQYASNFWPTVMNGVRRYAAKEGKVEPYAYGEVLGAGSNRDTWWYAPYMCVTDGAQSYDVREGVAEKNINKINGNYYGLGDPNYTVIWNESHDTFKETSFGSDDMAKAYAIQASRSVVTSMYLARPLGTSKLREVGETLYCGPVVSAANKFHNTYLGTGEYLHKNNGCFINYRGGGAMIVDITNSGSDTNVSFWDNSQQKLADGMYKDLVSGGLFNVSGGTSNIHFTNGVCVLVPEAQTRDFYIIGNSTFTGLPEEESWTIESGAAMAKTSSNLAELEGIEMKEGAKVKIIGTDGAKTDWYDQLGEAYTFAENESGTNNVLIKEDGTYNFYLNSVGVIYIVQTSGGGDEPIPTTVTYTITDIPDWITNDGCVVFAWAWGGDAGSGAWLSVTYGPGAKPTTMSFTTGQELNGFLLARCCSGTTTPNWNEKGDKAGRVYNKTSDINCISGTYSYNGSTWVGA